MAVSYSIDPDRQLVITVLSGALSYQECVEHHLKLAADPNFHPGYREIIDGSGVTSVSLDSRSVLNLAKSCPFGPDAQRAIVCGESMMNYGVARMFQMLAHGRHGDIRVFRDAKESGNWLEAFESGPMHRAC